MLISSLLAADLARALCQHTPHGIAGAGLQNACFQRVLEAPILDRHHLHCQPPSPACPAIRPGSEGQPQRGKHVECRDSATLCMSTGLNQEDV